jgi:putative sigma-54 modulation protein
LHEKEKLTMHKKITARRFELTPELKERADKELDSLTRFFDNIISAELEMEIERHRKLAELKVKVYNTVLTATGETEDMFMSIDQAVDKIKSQLKKHKGKLKLRQPEKIVAATERQTRPKTNPDEVDV